MTTDIKCPNCGHQFPMGEAVSEEYRKELREKMLEYKKQKDEEIRRREDEFAKREEEWQQNLQKREAETIRKMQEEVQRQKTQMEDHIRKSVHNDFENQLRILQETNKENEEKLKSARQQQLEFLKKEQALLNREQEIEIQIQKKIQEERQLIAEQIRQQEVEKNSLKETEYQLRMRELEKQLADQKKLADEMKRKAEQGSMQLQGEVQELELQSILQTAFPFDMVQEIGKGVTGADCILLVRNQFGHECGKIIFESKRTKEFSNDWIEKLKSDQRLVGADIAVLVTRKLPKDVDRFTDLQGVWVCSFNEVKPLVQVLRESIIKIAGALQSQQNKGDKMHMLYDYLTSQEFSEQWKAIREGFMSMKLSIQRERDTMEKLWKSREKQLEKVLLNAAHIKGSVEGIAGQHAIDFNLLEDGGDD